MYLIYHLRTTRESKPSPPQQAYQPGFEEPKEEDDHGGNRKPTSADSVVSGRGREGDDGWTRRAVHDRRSCERGNLRASRAPDRASRPRRAAAHARTRGRVHLRPRRRGRGPGRRRGPRRPSRRLGLQTKGSASRLLERGRRAGAGAGDHLPRRLRAVLCGDSAAPPPNHTGPPDEQALGTIMAKYRLDM